MIKVLNKLNIIKNDHLLLNQNWNFISRKLRIFHNKKGINCYEWLDKEFKDKNVNGKWIGFLHNAINYPQDYPEKYKNKTLCLSSLVKSSYFLEKLKDCSKLFVFTSQVKNFLIKETKFENIETLTHPAPDFIFNENWEKNKRVLHSGQQLRKYHSFLDLNTKKEKLMLSPIGMKNDIIEMKRYSKNIVHIKDNVDLKEYIKIIKSSIVFLDLYDVAACNLIIECIVLNVPILVKKLEGVVEYLGENYPFYFENIDEANYKIDNEELIIRTNKYLKNLDKNKYKINNFLENFYKNIF
jgi:hypothetical protein